MPSRVPGLDAAHAALEDPADRTTAVEDRPTTPIARRESGIRIRGRSDDDSTMTSQLTRALSLAIAGGLLSCSSGGGGSADDVSPSLVAASVAIAGTSPASGDSLLLTFTEDIVLVAGKQLDDADVALSSGASLGSVSSSPTAIGSRVVRVVLGAGVRLTPGVSTIAFGPGNDVVRDAGGNFATGTATTIALGDGDLPQVTRLTCNRIESQLNGNGLAGGVLQVPRNAFTIDVDHADASSSIATGKSSLTASVSITTSTGTLPPGTNLAPVLQASHSSAASRYFVQDGVAFPEGTVTLTAYVTDTTGLTSSAATFTFRVRAIQDAIRPFESGQLWFLDTSRDIESFSVVTTGNQTAIAEVSIVAGANGRSDLDDLLRIVGLHSDNPIALGGGVDSNEFVSAELESRILAELATLFPGVGVTFTFSRPGTFPSGQASVPYASFPFSQICIAGAAAAVQTGTLGAAILDEHNASQDDICQTSFQNARLGVFAHTFVRLGYLTGGDSTTFKQTFPPLTPSIRPTTSDPFGVPVGEGGGDAQRLLGTLADERSTTIALAIRRFARTLAVVVAHECGHSMGLVANGPMPAGLYGGDPVNFPLSPGLTSRSANGHIQNLDLFPADAQNVMSPAIDFESALSPQTSFNSLNLAYLRERILHDQ